VDHYISNPEGMDLVPRVSALSRYLSDGCGGSEVTEWAKKALLVSVKATLMALGWFSIAWDPLIVTAGKWLLYRGKNGIDGSFCGIVFLGRLFVFIS